MEILNKNDFNSEYITKVEKDYVLSNIGKISFLKGNTNEVVIIKKNEYLRERWPSGLRRTLGKRVKGKLFRGFESHSLRHFFTFFNIFLILV